MIRVYCSFLRQAITAGLEFTELTKLASNISAAGAMCHPALLFLQKELKGWRDGGLLFQRTHLDLNSRMGVGAHNCM